MTAATARLFVAALGLSAAAAAPATPLVARYKLTVGQELTYTLAATQEPAQPGRSAGGKSTAVYRVVGRTADGAGWHLVATTTDGDSGQVSVSAFDLWPDGRQAAEATHGLPAGPADDFPMLPPTPTANRWQAPTADGVKVYRPAATTRPAAVAFSAEGQSPMNQIYLVSETETDTFDPARGLVVHADGTQAQDYGFHVKQHWTRDLTADAVRPADDTARYAAQAATALAALRDYGSSMMAAGQSSDPAAVAQDALNKLTAARPAVTDPVLAAQMTDAIGQHGDYVKELDAERQARDAVVGHPAPAFDLADLSGGRHTLAEQHGKVVVLDFWYRGCGWCMRAMPEMRTLADGYVGRPVAFFGMNNDADPKDAAFVADLFKLPYPTLMMVAGGGPTSRPVAESFHVQGFPTVMVIGPDGIVRKMVVGFSPTLAADLRRAIDGLMP